MPKYFEKHSNCLKPASELEKHNLATHISMMRLSSVGINAPISIWIQNSNDGRYSAIGHAFSPNPSPISPGFSYPLSRPLPIKNHDDHEQDSVKQIGPNSTIATPDVIEIDEQIYENLYPTVFKALPSNRIRLEYRDETVDYDMDQADQFWLQKHETISEEKFEQVIEFLEKNSLRKVPRLEDLQAHEILHENEAELIYDYWIEKRLHNKQKMMFDIKRASETRRMSRKEYSRNPYIVFHQNNDRMHTRKNRLKDTENYIEMMEHRKDLAKCHSFFKSLAIRAKKGHDELMCKFETFQSLFQAHESLTKPWTGYCKYPRSEHDPSTYAQDSVTKLPQPIRNIPAIDVNTFTPRSGSTYFMPKVSDSEVEPYIQDQKKYCRLPNGLVRKRLGRGGRIIFDRRSSNSCEGNSEYKMFNINCYVKAEKIQAPFVWSPASTSTFNIRNSCKCKYSSSENVSDLKEDE